MVTQTTLLDVLWTLFMVSLLMGCVRLGDNNCNYSADIIIIIKKGWQCKAGRERLTPYQSEYPNQTTPTHRMKEEKGKTAGDKK